MQNVAPAPSSVQGERSPLGRNHNGLRSAVCSQFCPKRAPLIEWPHSVERRGKSKRSRRTRRTLFAKVSRLQTYGRSSMMRTRERMVAVWVTLPPSAPTHPIA